MRSSASSSTTRMTARFLFVSIRKSHNRSSAGLPVAMPATLDCMKFKISSDARVLLVRHARAWRWINRVLMIKFTPSGRNATTPGFGAGRLVLLRRIQIADADGNSRTERTPQPARQDPPRIGSPSAVTSPTIGSADPTAAFDGGTDQPPRRARRTLPHHTEPQDCPVHFRSIWPTRCPGRLSRPPASWSEAAVGLAITSRQRRKAVQRIGRGRERRMDREWRPVGLRVRRCAHRLWTEAGGKEAGRQARISVSSYRPAGSTASFGFGFRALFDYV